MKTKNKPKLTDISQQSLRCCECHVEVSVEDVFMDRERMHFEDDGAMITIPTLNVRMDQLKEFQTNKMSLLCECCHEEKNEREEF